MSETTDYPEAWGAYYPRDNRWTAIASKEDTIRWAVKDTEHEAVRLIPAPTVERLVREAVEAEDIFGEQAVNNDSVEEALRNATCDAAPYGWEPRTMGGYEITEFGRPQYWGESYQWRGSVICHGCRRILLWTDSGKDVVYLLDRDRFNLVPRKPDSGSGDLACVHEWVHTMGEPGVNAMLCTMCGTIEDRCLPQKVDQRKGGQRIEEVRHLSNPAITYVPSQIILDGNGKISEVVSGTIKLRQDGMLEGLSAGVWRKL